MKKKEHPQATNWDIKTSPATIVLDCEDRLIPVDALLAFTDLLAKYEPADDGKVCVFGGLYGVTMSAAVKSSLTPR